MHCLTPLIVHSVSDRLLIRDCNWHWSPLVKGEYATRIFGWCKWTNWNELSMLKCWSFLKFRFYSAKYEWNIFRRSVKQSSTKSLTDILTDPAPQTSFQVTFWCCCFPATCKMHNSFLSFSLSSHVISSVSEGKLYKSTYSILSTKTILNIH